MVRNLIYAQANLDPGSIDRLEVRRPVIENVNRKPGDVDWLCVAPTKPHLAVAVECKRVKVRAAGLDDDHENKIRDLGRGVPQANGLADMGFHRSFLMIIILADGRARRELGQMFRGPTTQTFTRIYVFPERERLNDDVGIIFVEVVQPTGRSIGEMAYVGVCVERPARPRDQSVRLTERVREALRAPE